MFARIVLILVALPLLASAQIDLARARLYFQEAHSVCGRDNGALWGVTLCGPMMFVDRSTRQVVANWPDKQGLLSEEQEVFTGKLPASETIANTGVDWAGVRWTEVVWQSVAGNESARTMLLMHESFHRIQKQLGIPMASPSNAHLDTLEGRILMQLEWRALEAALKAEGDMRVRAIADALVFSAERRRLFPGALSEENALERNEGLAEYTGVRLCGTGANQKRAAIEGLHNAAAKDTFVRSFAYGSGPAYGLLLDQAAPDWRRRMGPDFDFGMALGTAFGAHLPHDLKVAARAQSKQYDGDDLRATEVARNTARQERIASYRARLVDGPVLRIPLIAMQIQLNPDNVQPLEDLGTVYPTMRISDKWGILTVTKGGLIDKNWQIAFVPAPGLEKLQGDGWTLELNPGWKIVPGKRSGDQELRKE